MVTGDITKWNSRTGTHPKNPPAYQMSSDGGATWTDTTSRRMRVDCGGTNYDRLRLHAVDTITSKDKTRLYRRKA
jgi:hypothetical protein